MHHLEPINFSDSKAFENFICDYLSAKLGVEFITFGRNGQTQNGIDGIHYKPDVNSHYNVVQCKNYNDTKLTYNDIIEHLNKASNSDLKIDKFYFVTAGKKDVSLQGDFQKNYEFLISTYAFSIELLYYSDIYQEVINSYHLVAEKYSLPHKKHDMYNNNVTIKKERDLYHLLNIAYNTESSFLNIPYFIEKTRTTFNPQYSSFSTAITTLWEMYPDGVVFYDGKLNNFLTMFIDYDNMIDELLLPNYSLEPIHYADRCFYYEYIGKEEDHQEVKMHLFRRFENYSYTFKQFLAYLRDNYLELDITKLYYQDPFK
ncbi:hypothetical protein [Enterobacter ludwigii]|uniref:hypothetical protein n=1 Tax=Enterobacter ludwigii TaxID=299767 RepID=UPI003F6F6157